MVAAVSPTAIRSVVIGAIAMIITSSSISNSSRTIITIITIIASNNNNNIIITTAKIPNVTVPIIIHSIAKRCVNSIHRLRSASSHITAAITNTMRTSTSINTSHNQYHRITNNRIITTIIIALSIGRAPFIRPNQRYQRVEAATAALVPQMHDSAMLPVPARPP